MHWGFFTDLCLPYQEYPFARPNQGQGQFEPPQPKNSVYLAPSANSMGVLLLQNKNRKKAVVPNKVLRSLNVVYAPSEKQSGEVDLNPQVMDPSSIPISFVPQDYLEREIAATTIRQWE